MSEPYAPHAMKIQRALLTLLCPALTALLVGCPSGIGDEEASSEPPAPEAPEESAVPSVECTFEEGELLIDSIRLASSDGSCSLYLPATVAPGEYGIAISVAGADDVAAIEGRLDGERLIASGGNVTVSSVEGGRVAGAIDAVDENPPGTGRFTGTFDIEIPDL